MLDSIMNATKFEAGSMIAEKIPTGGISPEASLLLQILQSLSGEQQRHRFATRAPRQHAPCLLL